MLVLETSKRPEGYRLCVHPGRLWESVQAVNELNAEALLTSDSPKTGSPIKKPSLLLHKQSPRALTEQCRLYSRHSSICRSSTRSNYSARLLAYLCSRDWQYGVRQAPRRSNSLTNAWSMLSPQRHYCEVWSVPIQESGATKAVDNGRA